ncbi:MAG: AraC family transcriptional regulator [Pseudomonadota bacterium]
MPRRFEKTGLLTARAAMGEGFSVEIQRSAGCRLSLPYRRWHVVSFYPRATSVRRQGGASGTDVRQARRHVGVYPAGAGEVIDWLGPCEALHLHLDPQRVRASDGTVVHPLRHDPHPDPGLQTLAAALYEEVQGRDQVARLRLESLIAGICDALARQASAPLGEPCARIGRSTLAQVLAPMHGTAAASVRLADLAATAGVSQSYFSRRFRACFGCAPHDYLISSRVELAKHAVFRGETALNEIAIASGFYDQPHLARTFRDRTGLTIGAYRQHFDR